MIRFDRLRKLAHFAKTGVLGHAEFSFKHYNNGAEPKSCGTSGCLIGECPILFPKEWCYSESGAPVLISAKYIDTKNSGRQFFGLNSTEYDHLFVPRLQLEEYGGMPLDDNSTKEEVADNIFSFCDLQEANLKALPMKR